MYTNTSKLECSIPILVIPVNTSMYMHCMFENINPLNPTKVLKFHVRAQNTPSGGEGL